MSHQAKQSTKHLNMPSWLPYLYKLGHSEEVAAKHVRQRSNVRVPLCCNSPLATGQTSAWQKNHQCCVSVCCGSVWIPPPPPSTSPHPPPALQQHHVVHIIFVTHKISVCRSKIFLAWQTHLCHDKSFVTSLFSSRQKTFFGHDKYVFVTTKICLSQQQFCCDKHTFVATRDMFCHDKHVFVVTKLLSWQKWSLWQLLPMIVTGQNSAWQKSTLWLWICMTPPPPPSRGILQLQVRTQNDKNHQHWLWSVRIPPPPPPPPTPGPSPAAISCSYRSDLSGLSESCYPATIWWQSDLSIMPPPWLRLCLLVGWLRCRFTTFRPQHNISTVAEGLSKSCFPARLLQSNSSTIYYIYNSIYILRVHINWLVPVFLLPQINIYPKTNQQPVRRTGFYFVWPVLKKKHTLKRKR